MKREWVSNIKVADVMVVSLVAGDGSIYNVVVNILNLMIYLITVSGTPGPNTILSLQNASEKGIKKGIVLNYGMLTGITVITLIAYFIIRLLSSFLSSINVVLQALSVVYILYLSYKIYKKGDIKEDEGESDGSFKRGFLLQIVNVKVLMLCVTAISTYTVGYGMWKGLLVSLLIPLTCFLTGLIWGVAGEGLKNVYKEHRKLLNTIFALSLLLIALKNAVTLVSIL